MCRISVLLTTVFLKRKVHVFLAIINASNAHRLYHGLLAAQQQSGGLIPSTSQHSFGFSGLKTEENGQKNAINQQYDFEFSDSTVNINSNCSNRNRPGPTAGLNIDPDRSKLKKNNN